MRNRNRLLHPLLAVSACFSVNAVAQEAVSSGNWSDPSTWSDGAVPEAGGIVSIGPTREVVLDVSPPGLNGIYVDGKLSFSNDADLELTTEWIAVRGEIEIGTEANPHTANATITLTDNNPGEDMMGGMGDRGIMLSGGTLNLHGDTTHTWTKLSETAEAGATRIEVLDASGWEVGDQIVLASTDFNPRQAETRFITAIRGDTITLDEPLEYMHFGEITFDVDQRGEVGLLTRNVKVQASEDASESYFGGHIMAMPGSEMYVSGVELHRMGQNLTLARYPIHWHLVGDAEGQYIRNAAIHETYNRCTTVHGTNYLQVENNVAYNNVGHCFFLEDGIEHGNRFVRNLGIQTKCHTSLPCEPTNLAAEGEATQERQATGPRGQQSENVVLPSDNTVSTFWITNPDNTYIDNVAAGSDANGFWMSLPEHPNGQFLGTEISQNTWPRRTPFREFRGNVAHSNYDGFMFDRNINPDNTFGVTGSAHTGLADPSDPRSEALVSVFEDLTTYKNRNGGIWGRGGLHLFRNVKFADNAMGFTHAAGGSALEFSSRVVDSLFVGETENIGNPTTPEEIAYGRSLPKPMMPDFPIRGYEWYDYRHDVIDTTFVNFEDNDTRKTGAISHLLYTSFGASSNNTVENVTFENAKPVYYPPMERRWGNDNAAGSMAYRTAVFRDRDGSLGLGTSSYLVIHEGDNRSIAASDEACEVKPDWNAALCTGDVGRMSFVNGRGLGFSAIGGGFGIDEDQPVILSRDGYEISIPVGTNILANTEFTATTERSELELHAIELDEGNWVIVEIPGFANADSGTQVNSLNALRNASETSYYKDADALWVKLVSPGDSRRGGHSGGVMMNVSR